MRVKSWDSFKKIADDKAESIDWIDNADYYVLLVTDGGNRYAMELEKDGGADVIDFETNYKLATLGRSKVSTQGEFEQNELSPMLCKIKSGFTNDVATCEIKIPGTVGTYTRFSKDGYIEIDIYKPGDYISAAQVYDKDNILGYGAGLVLKDFIDGDVPAANKGHYLWASHYKGNNENFGEYDLENIGGVSDMLAGLWLKVEITRASGNTAPEVRVNPLWSGKK